MVVLPVKTVGLPLFMYMLVVNNEVKILSKAMEYTHERDRDFMTAYRREMRRAWEEPGEVDARELLRRAIEGGAPAFYVEFEYARRGVSARLRRRLRSRHRDLMRPKRLIWEDLADRVEWEMRRSRVTLRLADALARVLADGGAPRFYISSRTARRIVEKMRNESQRETGNHE